MPRVPIIVPRGLSREESTAWLLEAVTAAREAAGHVEAPELAEDAEPGAGRDEAADQDSPESLG